jgi:predicted Zn-dependent peptidase
MTVKNSVLSGGIRLLTLTPFDSELVSLRVAFRVGFAHESKEQLGISHMVEHLCFSDNGIHSFQEFRSAIETLSGTFNAHTQDTTTVFTLDLLVDHWREGLTLLKKIVGNPQFGPEACAREVKVRQILSRLLNEQGRIVVRQVPLMSIPATVGVAFGVLAALIALAVWVIGN